VLALKQAEELEINQLFRHLRVVMEVLEQQLHLVEQGVAAVLLTPVLRLLILQVAQVETAIQRLSQV
jgi:hypothetical protein